MTLDTVGIEKVLCNSTGFRVFSHFLNRHIGKFSIHFTVLLIGFGNFFFILTMAAPAPQAFVIADTWIHNQVTDAKQPCADIKPKPPTWQRVVVLRNAVPLMTCGFYFFAFFRAFHNVLRKQKPSQADEAEHDDNGNIYTPETTGKLGCCVHYFAP